MIELLRILSASLSGLVASGAFRLVNSSVTLDGASIDLEGANLVIQLQESRGELTAQVSQRTGVAEWFRVGLLRRVLAGDRPGSDTLDLEAAEFLVDHVVELDTAFGDDERRTELVAQLVAARRERASEFFGHTDSHQPAPIVGAILIVDEARPAVESSEPYETRQLRIVPIDTREADFEANLPGSLTRADVMAYLLAAPLVLSARGQVEDQRDPTAKRVPIGFRSDGEWVWSLEAERYVERDGMSLPAEFLAHIADLGRPPKLAEDRHHQIVSFITSGGGDA